MKVIAAALVTGLVGGVLVGKWLFNTGKIKIEVKQ